MPRPKRLLAHEHLCRICQNLPTDFEPYGQRKRDGLDCSCGCDWFVSVGAELRLDNDWGVCANPDSPRCGLLTFEHQGCPAYSYGVVSLR